MANTPDIRVRLSAEGVQEVVAALKNVQAQTKQAGAAAASAGAGYKQLANGADLAGSAVKTLAGAFAALKLAEFAHGAYDSAQALYKLSQNTGTSVEELSRLEYAASKAGIPADKLADGYTEFGKRIAEAAAGSGDAAAAFQSMGIRLKDNQGRLKTTSQLFGEVATKFSKYADGQNKAKLGDALFGDQFKELLQLLNTGADGLAAAGREADKLGVTLSTGAAKDAAEFSRTVASLTGQLTALARAGLGPVLKFVNDFIAKVREANNEGANWFVSLGGATRAKLADVFGDGAASVVGFRAELNKAAEDVGRIQSKLTSGAVTNPIARSQLEGQLQLAVANYKKLKGAAEEAAKATSKVGNTKPDAPNVGDPAAALALLKAKLDEQNAAARRELEATKANLGLASETYRQSYANGLIDLEAYNAARLAAINAENAAELAAARKALEVAKAAKVNTAEERERKSTAIKDAEAAVQRAELAGTLKLTQATAQFADELKQLNEQRAEYARQEFEETGKTREAALSALDDEIRKYGEYLAKLSEVSAAERERLMAAKKARGVGRIDFDEAQRNGQKQNDKFDLQKAGVESQLDRGLLWPAEAEQQLLKIEKDRVAALEKTAALMSEAAEKSGNKDLIALANQNTMAVQRMKDATDEYGKAVKALKEGIQTSVNDGLNTMLDSIIDGTASASDALRAFALDVVNSLRKIAQQFLVNQAITSFFGAFGGGGGAAAGAVTAATGGHIRGAGTGTSDSIPAWLSNGEFVVRSAVVQQPGVLDALHQLNRGGRLPSMRAHNVRSASKFADGGLVGSMAEARSGGSSKLEIGLEDGLVLRTLQTNAGQQAVVKALGAKRRAARQMGL